MHRRWSLVVLFYFLFSTLVFCADENNEISWLYDVINPGNSENISCLLNNDRYFSKAPIVLPLNHSEKMLEIIEAKLADKKSLSLKIEGENYSLKENKNVTQLEIQSAMWNEAVLEIVRGVSDQTSISLKITGKQPMITNDIISSVMKKNWRQIVFVGDYFIEKDAFRDLNISGMGLSISFYKNIFELQNSQIIKVLNISSESWDENLNRLIESLNNTIAFNIFVSPISPIPLSIDETLIEKFIQKNWQEIKVDGPIKCTHSAIKVINQNAPTTKVSITDNSLSLLKGTKRRFLYFTYEAEKFFENEMVLAAGTNTSVNSIFLSKMPSQETLLTLANEHKFNTLLIPEKYVEEYASILDAFPNIILNSSIKITRDSIGNTRSPALDVSGVLVEESLNLLRKACPQHKITGQYIPDADGKIELFSWDEETKTELRKLPNLEQLFVFVNNTVVDDFVEFARERKLSSGCIVSAWNSDITDSSTTRIYFGKIKDRLSDMANNFDPAKEGKKLSSREYVFFTDTDVDDKIITSLSLHPGLKRVDLTGSVGVTMGGIEKLMANPAVHEIKLPQEFLSMLDEIWPIASRYPILLSFAE